MADNGDSHQTRWSVVALAWGAGVIAAMQVGKAAPAILAIRADLLIGLVTAGWVISCFSATSAVAGALVGVFTDRIGHRKTLLNGLLLLAAGSLWAALASSGTTILLARFVEGIGLVAIVVAAPALISASTSAADRSFALAAWGAYMPAGMALTMLFAPLLLSTIGWRGFWLANSVIIVFFTVLFLCTGKSAQTPGAARSISDLKAVLTRPGPWLLAACFTTYALQWHTVMAWLPAFLAENFAFSTTRAALIVALVVAVNVPGNLLGGWLLRRGVARWRQIGFTCLAMGLLAQLVFSELLPAAGKIALALVYSAMAGLVPSAVMAAVPSHAPSPAQIGAGNGVIVQGSNIGTLIGPPAFAALIVSLGGWSRSGWLLFGAGCAGFALALWLRHFEREQDAK